MNEAFESNKREMIRSAGSDKQLGELSSTWINISAKYQYSYNFTWLGRPIIQLPQDIVAMQELIWQIKPSLVIETGIAHGGSLILYASVLNLIGEGGQVLGIDIDIREHNRIEIEKHPMFKCITLIQGSSVDDDTVSKVYEFASGKAPVLVVLDSNHTHAHVLREIELYSPLVTSGSYLVVFDTVIEDMPVGFFHNRPWGKGDNPKTAVQTFLQTTDRFVVDEEIDKKLLLSSAPGGYLKCVKS